MNDDRILELYNKRSESAIALTKDSYNRYLMHVAYSILKDFQDSEECVSDGYLKTWNSIPPAKPSNLKLYIAKIVRNKAIDMLLAKNAEKRGGGQVALCLDELAECIGEDDSDNSIESAKDIINEYLKTQDVKKAKIFIRRYWYMDSIDEIATYNNCSISKVKTTLFRMRQELKEKLSNGGISI